MKLTRLLCLCAILSVSWTIHAQDAPGSVAAMTNAAKAFVASLDDDQREKVFFDFDNIEEREGMRPVPFPTTGLRFDGMSEAQVDLAHNLLRAGLSADGYKKASEIIKLDDYLVELEEAARGRAPIFHGSRNYNIAIFGQPSDTGAWAWRFHGHHAYLAFTIVEGKAFATAPAFFGAEPHDVTEGRFAPWRVLADEEDLGSNLMRSLNEEQLAAATISDRLPSDMYSGNKTRVDRDNPKGIAYTALNEEQQAQLQALVMEYVNNSPEDLRHERIARIESGGWDAIHFGWIGSPERGERNYYSVQGPNFLIEYCAVAMAPNHIHTVWRDYDGDFGRDILAEHHAEHQH